MAYPFIPDPSRRGFDECDMKKVQNFRQETEFNKALKLGLM